MNAAHALIVTAAGALLLAAGGYAWRRQVLELELEDGLVDADDIEPDWTDEVDATLSTARNLIMPTPAAQLRPSAELLDMLKRGEALRLHAYRLGDGGWTIGYGRYYPDNGPMPPDEISLDQAEAWFELDVEQRGARWVRAYVTAPLLQHQFDALTHIAYNLSPKSFRTVANAVNAGDDPEQAALAFVRAGTNLERGLRIRRGREIALYREGTYA